MPLYMLSRYVKEETSNSAEMLFVEDCCRYRRLYGNVARGAQCTAMVEAFGGEGGDEQLLCCGDIVRML